MQSFAVTAWETVNTTNHQMLVSAHSWQEPASSKIGLSGMIRCEPVFLKEGHQHGIRIGRHFLAEGPALLKGGHQQHGICGICW